MIILYGVSIMVMGKLLTLSLGTYHTIRYLCLDKENKISHRGDNVFSPRRESFVSAVKRNCLRGDNMSWRYEKGK